jgi:hypothetical protein
MDHVDNEKREELSKLLAEVEEKLRSISDANQIGRLELEKTRVMCKYFLVIETETKLMWGNELLRLTNELEEKKKEQNDIDEKLRDEAFSINYRRGRKSKRDL